ncbi:tRNA(His) guanylyltransferase Thg1 family protein [Candidatus Dojkabacteria bacterium]|jgi:tRNA(His) 5'-end guanylyltransferase|nr:tRNA(His) guanylyltransferase Thg1 family protein [Candidatus Dojkabacteria bacterium]
MEFKKLEDWCKWLEKNFSPEVMIPTLPVILRFDGNNFSTWTKGLEKPFDKNLTQLMIETTEFLTKETNAVVSYTQSDEITLILYSSDRKKSIYNDGKKQKILSKLTGKCVTFFNERRKELLPKHNKLANFDCRIYQTPTLYDATLQLLWRENDATKNSISMLAQYYFSHDRLNKVNTSEMQDMLMQEKSINWNDLEIKYKRGTYIKRIVTSKPFTKDELDKLPSKHNAHKNPDLIITRSVVTKIEYPIFNKITNKEDVIFFDAEPIIKKIENENI